MIIKDIYCANCQKETAHKVEAYPSEILASCDCGRSIKFPPVDKAGKFRDLLDTHKLVNQSQIKATDQVKVDKSVLDAIENA